MKTHTGEQPRSFALDGFEIRPSLREVVGPEGPVLVESRSMEVLMLLAERADDVVSREELLNAVWGEQFVTEEVLTHAVWDLRRALGDDPKNPRFIQTLPKRGYRLTAKVSWPGSPRTFWVPWLRLAAALAVTIIAIATWRLATLPESAHPPLRAVPLTGMQGMEVFPALSPSGDRVAFGWNGGAAGRFHLFVKRVSGGDAVQLTAGPADDYRPTWSPDGQEVAFLRTVKPGMLGQSDVFTIPALGGPERRLGTISSSDDYDRGWSPGLAWSPDARHLAVVDMAPEKKFAIFLISLETGEKRRLTPTRPRSFEFANHPAFSPDGKTLAFAADRDQVYLQPLPGGEPELLAVAQDRLILDLDWVPDGSAIVFSSGSETEAGSDLRRLPVEGGSPARLPYGAMAETVSIATRGARLVYDQRSWFNTDLWLFPGPNSETEDSPKKLTVASRADWGAEFSPDGTKIAFASERSGSNNIWLCDSDGTECSQLTHMERATRPRWSPDGAKLLFFGQQEAGLDLYVLDVEGRFTQPLEIGMEDFRIGASWSHDGRWIYFSKADLSEDQRIWKIPAEGGRPVRLSTPGYGPRESAGGEFLYYADLPPGYPECSIWRVRTDGERELPVTVTGKQKIDCDAWNLWKESLVYRSWDGSQLHLERLDIKTLQVTRFYSFEVSTGRQNVSLTVSPDGRWVVGDLAPPGASDLMLVEGFR